MEKPNQMQKFSQMQLTAKSEEVLVTAKKIIDGTQNVAFMEMNLKIEKTLEKPIMKTVFKSEDGGMIAFGVIQVLIKRFLESFGFSTKPSQVLIESMTVDMLSKFECETLDDIVIFLKMCRQGELGTTNKGVDSNLIFGEWFPKYMDIKAQKREEVYLKNKVLPDDNNAVKNFYIKQKALKEEKEKLEKMQYEIDKMVQNMDKQMLEDTIFDWSKKPHLFPFLDYLKRKRMNIK